MAEKHTRLLMTRKMTSNQFRAALEALGLNQSSAVPVLGKSIRSIHGYANGEPIPNSVRLHLEALKAARLAPNNKPASAQ